MYTVAMNALRLSGSPLAARGLLVVLLSATAACGGKLGPIVTDVQWGEGGELVVTRCMLDVESAGNITSYSVRNCKRSVRPRPSSTDGASQESNVPPPAASSITTAQ
jgi:hypothetical protein